jgi:polysaccharide pyruvyl transferase WcaK-like protein
MSGPFDELPDPILVVGGYGYRNVGDEAILAGLLNRLEGRRVTVVSRDPRATSHMHGIRAVGIGTAVVVLPRHRSVIIGGGGLFGPDMGRIGRLLPGFGIGAAALGHRVVIEGVDVEPELAPHGARSLVPRLMRRASRVTVRDRRSAGVLERWGVRANLAPDLSLWMPAAPAEIGRALLRGAGVDLDRPVVGVALTDARPQIGEAALAAMAVTMDALPEVEFCFIPMSRHPRVPSHDDLLLGRRLQALQPRLTIVEHEHHPSAVLAAFGQLVGVVSMRYHAMLFAERAAVPLVPLVYAEKNVRWLDEHGMAAVPAEGRAVTEAVAAGVRRMRALHRGASGAQRGAEGR